MLTAHSCLLALPSLHAGRALPPSTFQLRSSSHCQGNNKPRTCDLGRAVAAPAPCHQCVTWHSCCRGGSVLRNVGVSQAQAQTSKAAPAASTRPGLLAGCLAGRRSNSHGETEKARTTIPSLLWGSLALKIITSNCINGIESDYPKIGRKLSCYLYNCYALKEGIRKKETKIYTISLVKEKCYMD